jgi:hypothetical protein
MGIQALLSAESAGQQSPGQGCEAAAALGGELREQSPERAAQAVSPFQGLFLMFLDPGFRPLCGLHPGLCCRALSALNLTPILKMGAS